MNVSGHGQSQASETTLVFDVIFPVAPSSLSAVSEAEWQGCST